MVVQQVESLFNETILRISVDTFTNYLCNRVFEYGPKNHLTEAQKKLVETDAIRDLVSSTGLDLDRLAAELTQRGVFGGRVSELVQFFRDHIAWLRSNGLKINQESTTT
jgi:hypothetical protein